MTDDQLRTLVRDAVARHLGPGHEPAAPHAAHAHVAHGFYSPDLAAPAAVPAMSLVLRQHPSHYRYGLASGDETSGPCLIEPSVRCNHCGYCQSHGH
jgi:hypothetical protein